MTRDYRRGRAVLGVLGRVVPGKSAWRSADGHVFRECRIEQSLFYPNTLIHPLSYQTSWPILSRSCLGYLPQLQPSGLWSLLLAYPLMAVPSPSNRSLNTSGPYPTRDLNIPTRTTVLNFGDMLVRRKSTSLYRVFNQEACHVRLQ